MSKYSQKMDRLREDRRDGYVPAGDRPVTDGQGRFFGSVSMRHAPVGSRLLLNLAYRNWEIVTKGQGVVLDANGEEFKPDSEEGKP